MTEAGDLQPGPSEAASPASAAEPVSSDKIAKIIRSEAYITIFGEIEGIDSAAYAIEVLYAAPTCRAGTEGGVNLDRAKDGIGQLSSCGNNHRSQSHRQQDSR